MKMTCSFFMFDYNGNMCLLFNRGRASQYISIKKTFYIN